jgi:DNA repair protein RecO (recombination protein O)
MHTFTTEGIVLKRSNSGEADRIVTVYTRDHGKIACIAKGVRKITSTKKSALEPGTYSKIYCAEGKGMPILTQAQIIEEYPHSRSSLHATRSLVQILEILDAVMVEQQEHEESFDLAVEMLRTVNLNDTGRKKIISLLQRLLENLGFESMEDKQFSSVTEYVEFLSEKKMKSFKYLTVKSS